MTEIWKPVKKYEGLYEVSNLGRVKSMAKTRGTNHKCIIAEKVMSPRDNGLGYLQISFSLNSCKKTSYVHRLVADHFIGDLSGKEVNHIDGNKLNNASYNLEIVTRTENERHAHATGLKKMTGRFSKVSKQVLEFDLSGSFIRSWDCVLDIVRNMGIDNRGVVSCCNGYRSEYKGRVWKWES